MVFLTEYKVDGDEYGGSLIARNLNHAKRRAEDRALGETVLGQLEAIIPVPKDEDEL